MRIRSALLPFVVVALLLGACGGDDDEPDASSDDTTSTTAPAEDDTGTSAGDTTDDGDDGDDGPSSTAEDGTETTEDESSTTDVPAGEDHPFCQAYPGLQEALGDSPNTLEGARQSLDGISDEVAELTATAPDEIAAEIDMYVDFLDELRDVAEGASSFEDFEAAINDLASDEEFVAASTKVQSWTSENCPDA